MIRLYAFEHRDRGPVGRRPRTGGRPEGQGAGVHQGTGDPGVQLDRLLSRRQCRRALGQGQRHDHDLAANFNAASRTAIDLASPVTLKPEGWLAGVQVGYNMQVNHVVLGLEGDADWVNGSDSRALVFAGPPAALAGDTLSNSTKGPSWRRCVRAGRGVRPQPCSMSPAGLAVGTVKTTDSMTVAGGTVLESTTTNRTRTGWAAGGGFEYAFWDTWSVKGEFLHVNLGGTYDTGIACLVGCGPPTTSSCITDTPTILPVSASIIASASVPLQWPRSIEPN